MPEGTHEVHDMRPGCAKEFGKIQAQQEMNQEFRIEVRHEFQNLKEALGDIVDIKAMLAEHIGAAGGGWDRIEALEANHKLIESRMWQDRLKTSGVTGLIILLADFLISKFAG